MCTSTNSKLLSQVSDRGVALWYLDRESHLEKTLIYFPRRISINYILSLFAQVLNKRSLKYTQTNYKQKLQTEITKKNYKPNLKKFKKTLKNKFTRIT